MIGIVIEVNDDTSNYGRRLTGVTETLILVKFIYKKKDKIKYLGSAPFW